MLFHVTIAVEHYDQYKNRWTGYQFNHRVRAVSRKHALDKAIVVGEQTPFVRTLRSVGREPNIEATLIGGPIKNVGVAL